MLGSFENCNFSELIWNASGIIWNESRHKSMTNSDLVDILRVFRVGTWLTVHRPLDIWASAYWGSGPLEIEIWKVK